MIYGKPTIQLTTLLFVTGAVMQVKSETLRACKDGYYQNANGECIRCSRCSRKQQLIQKCTELTDTICLCPEGTYHHLGTLSCKACEVCGIGYFKKIACNTSKSTVCERCSVGYTTNGNNSMSCFKTKIIFNGSDSGSSRHSLNVVAAFCNMALALYLILLS